MAKAMTCWNCGYNWKDNKVPRVTCPECKAGTYVGPGNTKEEKLANDIQALHNQIVQQRRPLLKLMRETVWANEKPLLALGLRLLDDSNATSHDYELASDLAWMVDKVRRGYFGADIANTKFVKLVRALQWGMDNIKKGGTNE